MHVRKLPTEVSCNILSSSYLGLVAMNCVGLCDNRSMHDIKLYQNVYYLIPQFITLTPLPLISYVITWGRDWGAVT